MSERNDAVQFEEEGNESFYESFDRVLSSCSCSTSNSDYDSDPSIADPTRDPRPFPVLKFPMGVSGFDLWKSEPESVSERRTRLLSEMGLCRVPDLAPSSQNGSGSGRREKGSFHFVRLVSSDGLTSKNHRESLARGNGSVSLASSCAMRLRSRIAVSNNFDRDQLRMRNVSPCSSSSSHVCSPSIRSVCSSVNILNDVVIDRNVDDGGKPSALIDANCFSVCGAAFENKQPPKSIFRDIGGNPSLSGKVSCNSAYLNGRDVFLEEQMYTIKDLDNGKEFVVNEVREDGTWEKLKEVGTGRQLTIEEFELCVGTSPIVLELMRRQNVEEGSKEITSLTAGASGNGETMHRRRGSWLKSIRSVASNVTGYKERRSTDERDSLSERGQRFSSATDDSRDSSFHEPERVKVRQYGKSCKELTALFKSQEIQAHNGSIWSIKFSLDGQYLATAGEDRVIHVWQVVESERKGELLLKEKLEDVSVNLFLLANGSPERASLSPRRRGRRSFSRKSLSLENIVVPETVFGLLGKPVCSFLGHLDDVLDLSWSKSLHLLSSSMDKTVRLWDLSSKTCLKIFSHSDYVTCIQFNPVDDSFFISGSLDAKVRIWSIPDHQVVDWTDLREMITAACYTPDGQGALVGSYKGTCCLYNILENKFQQKSEINLQNRKKKPHHKKITGFQFVPGSSSEVLITSADSRTRVVDGVDLVHKFKGFRNTNSQISASLTSNGRYLVSASEDSHVYVWNHDSGSRTSRSKRVTVTNSYEHFCCQDVSVAIPWLGKTNHGETSPDESSANHPPTPVEQPCSDANKIISTNGIISNTTNRYFFDRISATWPEEKLILAAKNRTRGERVSVDSSNGVTNTNGNTSAWSMVIVTGSLRGEIRIFQNFGLPVRL